MRFASRPRRKPSRPVCWRTPSPRTASRRSTSRSPNGRRHRRRHRNFGIYFSLSYWLYLPQTWIIIGILGILLELTDGSRIFFLPIGLAGLDVSAHVKLTFDNALDPDLLPETWYWLAMEWMIIAAAISVLLVSYRRMMPKPENSEDDDINSY